MSQQPMRHQWQLSNCNQQILHKFLVAAPRGPRPVKSIAAEVVTSPTNRAASKVQSRDNKLFRPPGQQHDNKYDLIEQLSSTLVEDMCTCCRKESLSPI